MAGTRASTPSLDQRRAAFAWARITEHLGGLADKEARTTYCNLAKSAPALVMGNGLMQTLAFFEHKARDKQGQRQLKAETGWLNDDILAWLGERLPEMEGKTDFAGIMTKLHSSGPATYQRATEEALELLRWLRQLAPAMAAGE